ncbi:MAG: aconitate hydratase AcnA [Myxococcales bacterium]|nr:aconitate hydratase AcnA [Myxococcales bacterium]
MNDGFGVRGELKVDDRVYGIVRLDALQRRGLDGVSTLPRSIKVLLENLLRHEDGVTVRREDVEAVAGWDPRARPTIEIAFRPARVLLQDFTGVPCMVDLAAMRDRVAALGGRPERIDPLQPVDLVVDHSVQVDAWASPDAFDHNVRLELSRNAERYRFLKWAERAFGNVRIVPPGTGIVHQVNLEYLARVVFTARDGDRTVAFPDSLVGTDSHTTMINALGVLGWGVGGIEAEAAMLGQPVAMLLPDVVGVHLHGTPREGVTATDLVLSLTERLRRHGVVDKFVEFFGPGLGELSLPDRATLANMAPEYGATIGFFPIDAETLAYLRFTGRDEAHVALVEAYARAQGLFCEPGSPEPRFTEVIDFDLGAVEPCLAGPRRPQDRVPLGRVRDGWRTEAPTIVRGRPVGARVPFEHGGERMELADGAVVIAAITSCTNTSNPAVMLAAGLLARRAVERGLRAAPWVKTSLAPGSQVVVDYLREAGLMPALEALGFHLVGFGCTTCIGNSGPLSPAVEQAIREGDLAVVSVLSGNRNFEGRVHPLCRANYLASPPLVVAYALAGRIDVDLTTEPLGTGSDGRPVYLRDLWPTNAEIRDAIRSFVRPEQFVRRYADVSRGPAAWRAVDAPAGAQFAWDERSTYIRRAPFFDDVEAGVPPRPGDIVGARALAVLGDSVTTDHISPAGNIARGSPAARYLEAHGVAPADFNQYGARRGNHEVMVRGTFANIRLRNALVPGVEGGMTRHLPSGEVMTIWEAAERYRAEGVPLLVLAGKEYGTGSSRDWAAKGVRLLGVRAVLAESFERIHRTNLVGLGVLPLEFEPGASVASLGLTGEETFDIRGIAEGLSPRKRLEVVVGARRFTVTARLDNAKEVEYFEHGGILPYVLRQQLAARG